MIDVHAHLCFPDFDRDREEIIEKCKKELTAVIVASARYDEAVSAVDLCRKHKGFLFPTIGYHPIEGTRLEDTMKLIKKYKDEIVGIGEVGLDYHWEKDESKHKEQKKKFEKFITMAEKLNKPLVIHSWDAEREAFEMLKGVKIPVVFHSFSGKKDIAQEILKYENMYISFSTQILFSKNHKKLAKIVPLERFTLETDAPFLSPNKDVDRRNYPWNIKISARKIAELKKITVVDVLKNAEKNAIEIFKLKV